MGSSSPETGLALGRGGPLLALLRKTKLLRDDGHRIVRPSLATIAVTWLPLVLLAPVSPGAAALLTDFSVHARLLISIPLLFQSDVLLHELSALALGRFAAGRVTEGLNPGSIAGVQRQAERLRSSGVGELLCLLFAVLVGQLSLWGRGRTHLPCRGSRPLPSPQRRCGTGALPSRHSSSCSIALSGAG